MQAVSPADHAVGAWPPALPPTAQRRIWRSLFWLATVVVTVFGGALRVWDLDRLGFRIDEGFSLTYSRQDWISALGFHGFYSPHPPLFFATAKLAGLVVPETIAGRTVSAIAGTLTLPLLALIARRMGEPAIGIAAAALLAIHPLHLEYSRDGRMYTQVLFLITLAWLALVEYRNGQSRVWLAVLTFSLALSFYVDYSAAYAALPLAVLVLLLAWRTPAIGRPLALACGAAVVLYLPWIPQIIGTIERSSNAEQRADYLGASWTRIGEAIPVLLGMDRWAFGSAASFANPWHRWADVRPLLVLPAVTVLCIALVLLRRHPRWIVPSLLIAFGAPLASIALSTVSPGFAARTVMGALLGWLAIAAIAFAQGTMPRWVRVAATVTLLLTIIGQAMTVPAIYEVQGRDEWPRIAADLQRMQPLDAPVLVFSTAGMLTDVLDLYGYDPPAGDSTEVITLLDGVRETWTGAERWFDRGVTLAEMEDGALRPLLTRDGELIPFLWLVLRFGGARAEQQLNALGYETIGSLRYPETTVHLLAQPTAEFGTAIPAPNDFAETSGSEDGWRLTDDLLEIDRETVFGLPTNTLRMHTTRARATFRFSVPDGGLVSLDVNVRGPYSVPRMIMVCKAVGGETLLRTTFRYPDDMPTQEEDAWRRFRMVTLCPLETSQVDIVLQRNGDYEIAFADARVRYLILPETNVSD